MPKATFLNLPEERRNQIERVLIELLSEEEPSRVTVKQIIDRVDFSRAAFYKYFIDLGDAINYVTRIATNFVHKAIMREITTTGDFFLGSRNYLAQVADYAPGSREQRLIIVLLNGGNSVLFKRTLSAQNEELVQHFLHLLQQNQINIEDQNEAISFLYLMMSLVIDALFDYTSNHWTKSELLADFDLRTKWLLHGILRQ